MVLKKIRSVLERVTPDGALSFGSVPLQPQRPFYAIGDIHGRDGVIEPLLEVIDADLEEHDIDDPVLVFLGDYVDHGPNSAHVLDRVYELSQMLPDSVVCLRGNHEQMILNFIDDPVNTGMHWLQNGGVKTLASYDVPDLDKISTKNDLIEASVLLSLSLPDGVEAWLRNLPLIWTSGNVSCVHAGMDPLLPPDKQSAETLLWGHPDFDTVTRLDKHWVVHGHAVVTRPQNAYGRIAIDTGAWQTGLLTAVAITGGSPRFLADLSRLQPEDNA